MIDEEPVSKNKVSNLLYIMIGFIVFIFLFIILFDKMRTKRN